MSARIRAIEEIRLQPMMQVDLESDDTGKANDIFLPARMLNEYVYCPRLFYLEWVEQEWADNHYTLDGKRVHKRVDKGRERVTTADEAPRTVRSLDLSDEQLQLTAKIDLAEFDGKRAVPFDYKRGKIPNIDEQAWEPERVQICAQALLLRAHGFEVEKGVLYFAASKRRVEVEINPRLEAQTLELRDRALATAESEARPPVLEDDRKCRGCSLAGICLPEEHRLLLGQSDSGGMREVRAQASSAFPLHIAEAGTVVRKEGDELIIEPRTTSKERVRLREVSSLVLHGSSKVTTPALQELMSRGVSISYLSRGGWLYGRTRGPSHKNVLLRIGQFSKAGRSDWCLQLAKTLIRSKVRNSRTLLRRHAKEELATLVELSRLEQRTEEAASAESLLGIEGQAAAVYFRAFSRLLAQRAGPSFAFERRSRRPARDPTNAVLSFVYALLTTTMTETIDRIGLDPYLGFYHRPRYGKPALALDLMESFRPIVADSVVLSAISRKMISSEGDFVRTRSSCFLSAAGRRSVIRAYESRLDDKVIHPVFGYRVSYRQVLEIQARLLGRFLTDELDHYPDFETR